MKLDQSRQQLRDSSDAELKRVLEEERKNLFMARRDTVTRQLENPHRIRQIRKKIARIITIEKQREIGSAEAKG
jgi:large subunit ribosomal protein L29